MKIFRKKQRDSGGQPVRIPGAKRFEQSPDGRHSYLKIKRVRRPPEEAQSQPQFDLPEYQGQPEICCVIASTPRSGSSLLGRLLRENGLGVPAEYLHPVTHLPFLAHRWNLLGDNRVDIDAYFRACFRWRTTREGVFTLKAHWKQFQPFLDLRLLPVCLTEARFALIRRRDLLGQAISRELARQTGQWSVHWPGKDCVPEYSGEAIAASMRNILHQNAQWRLFFARNNLAWQEVVYEDLLREPRETIQQVAAHLAPELKISPRVKVESSGLRVQRSQLNEEWRERFVRERGDWKGQQ